MECVCFKTNFVKEPLGTNGRVLTFVSSGRRIIGSITSLLSVPAL